MRTAYTIKTRDGSKYLGMTLEWIYMNRTVAKSMRAGHLAKKLK